MFLQDETRLLNIPKSTRTHPYFHHPCPTQYITSLLNIHTLHPQHTHTHLRFISFNHPFFSSFVIHQQKAHKRRRMCCRLNSLSTRREATRRISGWRIIGISKDRVTPTSHCLLNRVRSWRRWRCCPCTSHIWWWQSPSKPKVRWRCISYRKCRRLS